MTSRGTIAISRFFVHTASVESLQGAGARGDVYATSVAIACFAEDGYKLVRNAAGDEIVSTTTLYASLDDAPSFGPESRVTLNGRISTVIATVQRSGGSLGLPDHVEVHLT